MWGWVELQGVREGVGGGGASGGKGGCVGVGGVLEGKGGCGGGWSFRG